MTINNTSVWQYLGILLYILGCSKIFKMLVKTFENNGKNITRNIVKLNLSKTLNLFCMIIWSTNVQMKQIFDNFMISLPDKTETHFDTVHS